MLKLDLLKGGQFFIKVDGTPINSGDLANTLCRLSEFLNLLDQHFKPYSLRIGGSSYLHLSNIPVPKIKEICQWSSAAFMYVYDLILLQLLTEFGLFGIDS